ncbi:MAG: hypothetical protein DRQ39_10520 [Gammaproteobacteria bacterium]|nr:MAG: hypothetical protein DRQ39_10520 [Gammaproteobacteria bacterium]
MTEFVNLKAGIPPEVPISEKSHKAIRRLGPAVVSAPKPEADRSTRTLALEGVVKESPCL